MPDRWLLSLEAGDVTLEETCDAMAAYDWPDSTPANLRVDERGAVNPFPPGGWVVTVDAAFSDGRITQQQYEAIWHACGPAKARRRA